jgi:hypothetical protein
MSFINKRYKERIDETNFTDEDAMMRFIIERESKSDGR